MILRNFAYLIFSILFSSCGIYRQNVINVPLIQQKKILQLAGHGSFTGLEGQGSYSFSNKFAVMGNFNYLPTKTKTFSPNNFAIDKHHFGEIGVGYYKNIPRNRVFEIFLLAGQGSTSNFVSFRQMDSVATEILTGKYNRFVVQTDLGWIKTRWRLALTSRIFLLNYLDVFDNRDGVYAQIYPTNQLYADGAFTARYKVSNYVDFSSQVGITLPFGIDDSSSPFNASLGLLINIDFTNKSAE